MLYLSANASIGMTAVSEIRILPTYKYFRNCGKTSTQHGSSFNSITLSRHSFHSGFMSITWNTSLLAHKITRWAGYLFSPTTKHISDINCSAYMLAILCKTLVALFIWKWWNFFTLKCVLLFLFANHSNYCLFCLPRWYLNPDLVVHHPFFSITISEPNENPLVLNKDQLKYEVECFPLMRCYDEMFFFS